MGSSALAQALLGPWARAPKQARTDYERFIRAVSSLLGGEASSEEVQVSAPRLAVPLVELMPKCPVRLQLLRRHSLPRGAECMFLLLLWCC